MVEVLLHLALHMCIHVCVCVCTAVRVHQFHMDNLRPSSPFFSNRPFANCIDYLRDYCVAECIAPVVVSV